jgi:hypothetical protein
MRHLRLERLAPNPFAATFLFGEVNPVTLACFRVLLALLLGYVLWPRGVALGAWADQWPSLAGVYRDVLLSLPYRVCIYAALLWFAAGWQARTAGFVLFLVWPNAFLAKGRVSGQVLFSALLCTSLLRCAPAWRRNELRKLRPGPMWPIRLIQIQLTLLYAVNAIRKSTPEYVSGDVLRALSASRPNFLVDLTSGSMSIGPFVVPVAVLAAGTVAIEYWLAVGWWIPRCTRLTAAVGVAFHLFLKLFVIRIFLLDIAAMFLYLAFLLPFEASTRGSNDAVSDEQLRLART